MSKYHIICPAAKELHHKVTSDDYVVICAIVLDQFELGQSNFPNYTIEPSHCENYTSCHVWRGEKQKDWDKETGKYQSLEEFERIRM